MASLKAYHRKRKPQREPRFRILLRKPTETRALLTEAKGLPSVDDAVFVVKASLFVAANNATDGLMHKAKRYNMAFWTNKASRRQFLTFLDRAFHFRRKTNLEIADVVPLRTISIRRLVFDMDR